MFDSYIEPPKRHLCVYPAAVARALCALHIDNVNHRFRIRAQQFWPPEMDIQKPEVEDIVAVLEDIPAFGVIWEVALPILWQVRYSQGQTIDQSHRYGRHQAACREPAESYDKTTRTAICFEHKTQYILIRAPYTRIVVFWHISNILPPMILQSQFNCNTPTFYI